MRGVAQLISIAVLSRLLTPSEFGVVSAALAVINISLVFSELGVNAAVIQGKDLTQQRESAAFWLSMFTSALLFAVVFLFREGFSKLFLITELMLVLPIMAWGFVIKGIAQVSEAKINRELGFRLLALLEGSSYILAYAIVGPVLAYLDFGYWALVYSYLLQVAIVSLVCLIVAPPRIFCRPSLADIKSIFIFGNGITIGRLASYGAVNGDNLVVSRYLGVDALGIYGRAYQVLVMPAALIGQVLARVMFPVFSRLQENRRDIVDLYLRSLCSISLATLPLQFFLIVTTPVVVNILLGNGWEEVVAPLRIFFLGLFFRTAYKINESVLKALGKVRALAMCQLIYFALVIIFALIGLAGGIVGVAWGVTLAVLVYFLALTYYVSVSISVRLTDFCLALWPGLLLSAAFIGLALLLGPTFDQLGVIGDWKALGTGFCAFLATAALFLLFPEGIWGEYCTPLVIKAKNRIQMYLRRVYAAISYR